jgi:hypothetical protein
MDSIDLKVAGYHSLSDLLILSGRAELDLRSEAERLGIAIERRVARRRMDPARRCRIV